MAHLSKIFTKTPVEVSNRSAFDMSHENIFTAKCGTLTPCLVEELLPNDTISVGSMMQVQLPPMATDFYGRIDARVELFFVPNRIVWGGWQEFITHPTTNPYTPNLNPPTSLPGIDARLSQFPALNSYIQRGSLLDYLGWRTPQLDSEERIVFNNLLPLLAYHKIYEDWYMNTEIQKTPFQRSGGIVNPSVASMLPYSRYGSGLTNLSSITLNDGKTIFDLRQRLWSKDYFTTANLYPQAGGASSLEFSVSDAKGSFTIASLRAANSLQRWLERNNIAGYRYADQIKAQFGILPSDATMNRAIFLGAQSLSVYTKSIYSTAGNPSSDNSQNPFGGVASKFGTSQAVGEGSLCQSFTASEHGYLIGIFSLVPHAYYSSGCRRHLMRSKVGDFAFPLLQGVGEQGIYNAELAPSSTPNPTLSGVFGYTDQYAEYKYHDDEIHGLLADGQSLSAFALQRSFADSPSLGSSFLEIPTDFLDQVTAVAGSVSKFGCWVDMYFSEKKISSLAAYQIPTLGDIKNTHREYVDKGGRRL